MSHPDPSNIFQVAMGFMASKTLLAAIDLEVFTVLATQPLTAAQVGERLSLHPRSTYDFLDTLVSLNFLRREGNGSAGVYMNSADTDFFLDKNKRTYVGGMPEMMNHRLYGFWANLERGLRTGEPQNEVADSGQHFFEELYADEERLGEFLHAMAAFQMGNFMALAESFDFSNFDSLCDVGGALGALSVQVAARHPNIACSSFDLPPVTPFASQFVEAAGFANRIEIIQGDFFADALPSADVITMGNVLHDWNEEEKVTLMQKAYDALPAGGAFIAIENVIDDERRENTVGLLMSLNMMIETPGGFDYTAEQFDGWAKKVGFERTEIRPLAGPTSAVIAWKG